MPEIRFPRSTRRFFTGMGTITAIPTATELADEAACIEAELAKMEQSIGADIWAKLIAEHNARFAR